MFFSCLASRQSSEIAGEGMNEDSDSSFGTDSIRSLVPKRQAENMAIIQNLVFFTYIFDDF